MQAITTSQLWLAVLLPTVFAIGTLAVSIVGLTINNSRFNSVDARFNSVDARLLNIETKLGDVRERVTKVELRH